MFQELQRRGVWDKTTQYKTQSSKASVEAIGPLLDLVGDKELLGLVMPAQCQSQSKHDWMAPALECVTLTVLVKSLIKYQQQKIALGLTV